MSVMTSRSRPRSILMESGTVTPAILLKVSMKVSVAISPMGRFRISQGTLHLVSRARAAGPEARGPRATVPMTAAGLDQICHRDAPGGIHVVLAGLGAVQHIGGVGEHDDGHPQLPGQALDLFHVARFHVAGNNIDPVFLVAVGRGEIVHHALDHVGEAGDMRPHVAGGVGMNDVFPRRDLALIPGLGDDLGDVVPDGLRQAGGMDRNDLRLINRRRYC